MCSFEDDYEVESVATWSVSRGLSRVALQFPPSLLASSPRVVRALEERASGSVRFFVLGDTAFAPCCVDEVGAAHYGADGIARWGPSCLTSARALPAFHALGPRPPMGAGGGVGMGDESLAADARALVAAVERANEAGYSMILVWDTDASVRVRDLIAAAAIAGGWASSGHAVDGNERVQSLSEWRVRSPHAALVVPFIERAVEPAAGACRDGGAAVRARILGLSVDSACNATPELLAWLSGDVAAPSAPRTGVFYYGSSEARARAVLATCACVRGGVWGLSPGSGGVVEELSARGGRLLSARFRGVGIIRGASAVGVVAAAPSAEAHAELVHALARALKAGGKTTYTLLVGRLTPAKLANFAGAVDAFVLVACPEAALLSDADASAHALPVVAPWEALVALQEEADAREAEDGDGERGGIGNGDDMGSDVGEDADAAALGATQIMWDGVLRLGFCDVLARLERSGVRGGAAGGSVASVRRGDPPPQPQPPPPPPSETSTAVVPHWAAAGGGALSTSIMPAAERLSRREWRGLEYQIDADARSRTGIVEGRTGRASGYVGEGADANKHG